MSLEHLTASEAREELKAIHGRAHGRGKGRRNKFNAVRTVVGDLKFDSKREAAAWLDLKKRERAGEISDLRRQVRFELLAYCSTGPVKACAYVADFQYLDNATNKIVVADAKGVVTQLFKLKAKMLKANYGIEVELV